MDAQEAKAVVDRWAAAHPEWRPFFSEQNAAIVESWLIENGKPVAARSLDEAFQTLAASGGIISKDGTPPPGKPRSRTASAVLNPETPPPQTGPSAAELEYAQYCDSHSTLHIRQRERTDPQFAAWLRGQKLAEVHEHEHVASPKPLDGTPPSQSQKPAPGPWRLVELQDTPRKPRFKHGVKVVLPARGRFVAEIDAGKRTIGLTTEEVCGAHFSISDGRQLVKELVEQGEAAELR